MNVSTFPPENQAVSSSSIRLPNGCLTYLHRLDVNMLVSVVVVEVKMKTLVKDTNHELSLSGVDQ